ncbi:MAG: competence/damage-inducible protein A [Bacillota bacterium]|nr:competence/damage-inducible protein A [Bacillota bacterium]
MKAEILCIGTELLHGDIVNTNAKNISLKLAELGIDVYYHSVVGDNPQRIKQAFELALNRVDIVITTGGLGPTQDDITKEIAAQYFKINMKYNEESYQHVKSIYKRLKKDMPENNMRQAYFPEGSIILENICGTANGCIVEKEGKIAILMPGPPVEMNTMLERKVLPYLKEKSDGVVVGEKIIVTGLGESTAETMIMDLIKAQTNPTIAPFAGKGRVVFRITAKAENKEKAKQLIKPVREELLKRFGKNAYPIDETSIEKYISQKLLEKNLTIATAESCTGGLIASKLVDYPGISKVFKEGFVTYSNESKIKRLNVKGKTLEKYGAVSSETAEEMAKGAALAADTDIGLAVTGVAGPDGGTPEKPVGLVYIAIYYKGQSYVTETNYPGGRNIIRERSANYAFDFLKRRILS